MSKEKPKYTVYIDYTTGDSFNTDRVKGEDVGIVWNDYDKAVKAARLIRNHNDLIEQFEDTSHWEANAIKKAWEAAITSEWHKNYKKAMGEKYKKPKDSFELFYNFYVEGNDGEPVKVDAFWYGYFEHLDDIRVGLVTEHF